MEQQQHTVLHPATEPRQLQTQQLAWVQRLAQPPPSQATVQQQLHQPLLPQQLDSALLLQPLQCLRFHRLAQQPPPQRPPQLLASAMVPLPAMEQPPLVTLLQQLRVTLLLLVLWLCPLLAAMPPPCPVPCLALCLAHILAWQGPLPQGHRSPLAW